MASPQAADLQPPKSRSTEDTPSDTASQPGPGVGQLVSSIQHIIKDSAGTTHSRPHSSGHNSSHEAASLVSSLPPVHSTGAAEQAFNNGQQDDPSSLEDGMSEIAISEPAANVSQALGAPALSVKPRLSAPRKSLQPPTSPFATHTNLEDDASRINGRLDHTATQASVGAGQDAAPAGRSVTADGSMDDAEEIDVGGEDKDRAAPGVAVQARPFSPPPGTAAPVQAFFPQEPPAEFYEPPEFKGLLFYDGVDSLGRPVVVVDFDVVAPSTARSAVMQYILQRLEPIVSQGPYVLVLLTTGKSGSNRLKGAWLIAAYKGLSRPFRKNVKYILLVKPSNGIRALLLLFRPFVSRKAHNKLKRVSTLAEIAGATANEVQLQHLGPRFASSAGQYIADDIKTRPAPGQAAVRSFDMPSSGPF